MGCPVTPYSGKSKFGGNRYTKVFELPRRTEWVARSLEDIVSIATELFTDERFVTLLRAESLLAMPSYLAKRVTKHKNP